MSNVLPNAEQLLASHAMLQAFFVQRAVGVALIDSRTGEFLRVNERYCQMVGYSLEEMVDLSFQAITHPDDLEEDLVNMQKLRAGEISGFTMEKRYFTKAGDIIWVNLTVSPTWGPGEKPTTHIAIVEEITGRKLAEEHIRQKEQRFRRLAAMLPAGVYEVDEEGACSYANAAWLSMAGVSPEEAVGREWREWIHPDDRPVVDAAWDEVGSGGCFQREYRILSRTGNVTSVLGLMARVEDSDEHACGYLGVNVDITERKLAEEKNRELHQQLAHAQRLDAIGRLAGGVAHDMNNVLAGIMMSAELVEKELAPLDPSRSDVHGILQMCERGRALTRNLLGFARKGKYVDRAISVTDLVGEVFELLKRATPKTMKIVVDLAPDLPSLRGDATQLHQVLLNLCMNAVDATDGRGELRISASTQRSPRDPDDSSHVRLSVADDGCGMDPETLEHALEPFFTTKPEGAGTGLGLSMVYGTVKNHGGDLDIASTPGQGTTVTVVLPAGKQGVADDRKESPRPVRRGAGRILLADDEPLLRDVEARGLRKLGYEVVTAANGEEAVRRFVEHDGDFDVVVLDLVMPIMDGPEAFRALQRHSPSVRVLLCSGHREESHATELLAAGARGFLQKPFDFNTLAAAIHELSR